jgi:aryl carrier-like protein
MADLAKMKLTFDVSDVTKAEAALMRAEKKVQKFTKAFDEGRMDQKRYNQALLETKREVTKAGVSHQRASSLVKRYADSLRIASAAQRDMQTTSTRMGMAQQQATKKMSRMGLVTQQVGYQTGDFLVQIQSGTNAMVAFGQQATQLAGLLTGRFIALGAALGIIIPLATALGAAFMRTRDGSDDASKGIETLDDRLKALDKTVQNWLKTKKAAQMGITVDELTGLEGRDSAEAQLKAAREEIERLSKEQMVTNPIAGNAAWSSMKNLFGGGAGAELEEAFAKLEAAQKRIADIQRKIIDERQEAFDAEQSDLQQKIAMEEAIIKYGEDSVEVLRLQGEQRLANYEAQLAEQNLTITQIELLSEQEAKLIALENAQKGMEAGSDAVSTIWENLVDRYTEASEEQTKINEKVEDFLADVKEAKGDWDTLSKINVADGVAAAANEGSRLADNMLSALRAALGLVGLAKNVTSDNYVASGRGSGKAYGFGDKEGEFNPTWEIEEKADALMAQWRKEERDAARGGSKKKKKGGGSKKDEKTLAEIEKELLKRIELNMIIGEEGEILRQVDELQQKLGDSASKYSEEELRNSAERIRAKEKELEALEALQEKHQTIADTMESAFSDGFMSIVEGTSSVKDAFKDMARAVIKQLYDILVVQQLVGSFDSASGEGSGLVGAIMGAIIPKKASGGSVAANKPYLVGENGPELFQPGRSGTITNANLTANAGGGSKEVVINQSFNFSANGDESVKRIITEQAPRIAQYTKQQILSDKRRGGATKATLRG